MPMRRLSWGVLCLMAALDPRSAFAEGHAAILHEPDMAVRGAATSPAVMAAILEQAGIHAELLSADRLADPQVLNASAFDLLVLPAGQSYPVPAREAIIAFLRAGGGLMATGGYAFNHPMRKEGDRWISEADAARDRLDRATRKEANLLANGDFESGQPSSGPTGRPPGQWVLDSPGCMIDGVERHEGRYAARVVVDPANPAGGGRFRQEIRAKAGNEYRVSGWLKASQVNESGYAYIAVYQCGPQDKLVAFRDFAVARGTADWTLHSFTFKAEPGTERLSVRFGLYNASGTGWFDDIRLSDITGLSLKPLNTAIGKPLDGLVVLPEQIGIFDASFPLRRACRVRAAPGQHMFREPVELQGAIDGWAASGVVGDRSARWIPLLQTYDRYDRPRGAAGAMLLNYAGFYAGSCWAYFGVENVDLFRDPAGPAAKGLQNVARFLLRKTFLRDIATDHRLYRPGECVKAQVLVDNRGARPQRVRVRFDLGPVGGGKPATSVVRELDVQPRTAERAEAVFDTVPAGPDLVQVTATLSGDDGLMDEMTTGFVVERADVLKAGPELRFADNYFTLNGRPTFLFGTDTYAYTYKSAHENPLTWAEEHRHGRDIGMNLYENLQYVRPDWQMGEEDWRDFRAMAQLTQKHRLVFMPGMLIGHNVAIGDDRLRKQSDLCAAYAARLKDVPGLLYYVNGDYQMNLGDHPEEVRTLWNRWLKDRYGTADRLRNAWGAAAVAAEIGKLDFWPPNSGRWDDVAIVDRLRFQNWLTRRWNEAHVAAVRSHDREHPITSEYYQIGWGGMDLMQTIDGQDVANIGFFAGPEEDLDILPLKIRYNDFRARGKGVALGEYGVKTHPAWSLENGATDYHIVRTEEQQRQLFLAVAHYALGLGACKVQNWCLRDAQNSVFPWGLFHPNQFIPKDVAYVHRNLSFLWRFFSPRYLAPALTVCVPNNLRVGNHETVGRTVADNTFAALLSLHMDFNVIDDDHLDRIPPDTKVMIYPSPFALSDETYNRLLAWVRAGGKLLVTGDISYDENRRRTRTARLKELCGVEFVRENYPGIWRPSSQAMSPRAVLQSTSAPLPTASTFPCIEVKIVAARPAAPGIQPALLVHDTGNGRVVYFADPIELATGEESASMRQSVYRSLLALCDAKGLPIAPDEPWLHVMRQKTVRGNLHVVYDCRKADGVADVALSTAAGAVRLGVRNRYPALIAVTDEGRIVAVNAHGSAAVREEVVMAGAGLKALLSLDGEDLRRSKAMLVAPFEPGSLTLPSQEGDRTAVFGEFRDGQWTALERAIVGATGRPLDIDADRATCLILLCERGLEAKWSQELTRALLHPDRIKGY